MATQVPVQRQPLGNLGNTNIQSWTTVQNKGLKSGSAAPTKQPLSVKPATGKTAKSTITARAKSSSADVHKQVKRKAAVAEHVTETLKQEPIKVDPAPTEGHVRRIYSREFLVKFRYAASSFPPGVPTPADIIAQYNKDYEIKEAQAAQQDSLSSLALQAPVPQQSAPTTTNPNDSTVKIETPDQALAVATTPKSETLASKSAASANKVYKLRISNKDESILSRPMFSPLRQKTPVKSSPARQPSAGKTLNAVIDKENCQAASKPMRSAPAVGLAPREKVVKKTVPSSVVLKEIKDVSDKENIQQIPETITKSEDAKIVACAPAPPMDPAAVDTLTKKLVAVLRESDPRRLAQRQKQIDFGKNTNGYSEYLKLVPKSRRRRDDPKTPNKHQVCSKRSWDGQIRKWRRQLHQYDPSEPMNLQAEDDGDIDDVEDGSVCETDHAVKEQAL